MAILQQARFVQAGAPGLVAIVVNQLVPRTTTSEGPPAVVHARVRQRMRRALALRAAARVQVLAAVLVAHEAAAEVLVPVVVVVLVAARHKTRGPTV